VCASDCKQNYYWHKDHEVHTTRKQFGQASETAYQVAATATSIHTPSSARRLMPGVEIQAHGATVSKTKDGFSHVHIYIFLVQKGEALLIADCVLRWITRKTEGT
jgi:hypothetical protein